VHYVCEESSVWVSTVVTACDKKHNRHDILFPKSNVYLMDWNLALVFC